MLLAATLFVLGSAPISFTHPVAPLKTVIPEVSKATGLNLSVAKDMQWQFIYLRTKDVEPNDLLNRIAQATYGTWEIDSEGNRKLVFNRSAYNKKLAEAQIEREAWVRASLAADLKELTNQTPGHTVLRFANILGPKTLASIPADTRAVYSERPNRMQRQLPPYDPRLINNLVALANSQTAKKDSVPLPPPNPAFEKAKELLDPEFWRITEATSALTKRKLINSPPAGFLVVVNPGESEVTIELKLYDAHGNTIASDYHSLEPESHEDEEGETPPAQRPVAGPTFKLSKEAGRVVNYWNGDDEGREELVKKAKLFPAEDPFTFAYREIIDNYAQTRSENLVLAVSQEEPWEFERLTISEIEEWLGNSGELKTENGWRFTTLKQPLVGVDQDKLAQLVALIKGKPWLGLEDEAWIAANDCLVSPLPRPMGDTYLSESSMYMTGWLTELYGFGFPSSEPLLRAYGRLSPAEQQRLRSGQSIAFSSLVPPSRAEIEHFAFNLEGIGPVFPQFEEYDSDYISAAKRRMDVMLAYRGWVSEPTFIAPDGLSSTGRLSLTTAYDVTYLISKEQAKEDSVEEYAAYAMTLRRLAEMAVAFKGKLPVSELIEQKRESSVLRLLLGPGSEMREDHRFQMPGTADRKVKVSDLGEGFQKKVAELLKRDKAYEAYSDFIDTQRGGSGTDRRRDPPPL